MQKRKPRERGQALIIIAFAITGLVAMTGLAVDGGMAFSDRRHAQNAADTAAMAGALARLNCYADPLCVGLEDAETFTKALNLAFDNGYDNNLVTNNVEVYMCDDPASSCPVPYSNNPIDQDYVQVIITSHLNTYFARVIGISQVHNVVQAIALAKKDASGSIFGGDSIVALSPECKEPGTFLVGGTADIELTDIDNTGTVTAGGLFVNTEDPECGFQCNSTAGTLAGNVTTAGGELDLSDHCEENIDGDTAQDATPWDFPIYLELPPYNLEIPPECDPEDPEYPENGGKYANFGANSYSDPEGPPAPLDVPVTVLWPGSYTQFPPKKEQPMGALEDHILMRPGVYCVDSAIKLTTDTRHFIGENVMIFVRAGSGFRFEGGEIDIDAPDEGPYAGYLIIVEPDYSSSPEACFINGNSENEFTGAIFAPYCDVTINGSGETDGYEAQIIGYTVKIDGNGSINFVYDAEQNPVTDQPPKLGLMR